MPSNSKKYLVPLLIVLVAMIIYAGLSLTIAPESLLILLWTDTPVPTPVSTDTSSPMPEPTDTVPPGEPTSTPVPDTETPSPTASATPTLTSTFEGPGACEPPEFWQPYVVRRGDTLFSLASATGASVDELMQANCLGENLIFAGQQVYVPQQPFATDMPTDTPTAKPTFTSDNFPPPPPPPSETSIPAVVLRTMLAGIDAQLQQGIDSNIVFIVPVSMKLEETVKVELIIDLSASPEELMTAVLEDSGYPTSTADAGTAVTRLGGSVHLETEVIKVSELMQAELKAGDTNDFEIVELQDPIQAISGSEPTTWRWNVTAKERGSNKILTLTISRLLIVQDEDQWRPLRSYDKDITVSVTALQWWGLLDWKWILGIIVTALLIPLFFRWYDARKKADNSVSPPKPRNTPKKKK